MSISPARRAAKRAALTIAVDYLRDLAADDPAQDHAVATALDEVADELARRVARYDTPRTPTHRVVGEVDDLLVRIAATAGPGTTITTRSWPARARHGQHAVTVALEDTQVNTEGHTARTALRRALTATERRIRTDKKRGRAA